MSLIRKEIELVDMEFGLQLFSCRDCVFFGMPHNRADCLICDTEDECDEFDTEGKIIKSYIWVEDGLEA